jgi:hypothetical protein
MAVEVCGQSPCSLASSKNTSTRQVLRSKEDPTHFVQIHHSFKDLAPMRSCRTFHRVNWLFSCTFSESNAWVEPWKMSRCSPRWTHLTWQQVCRAQRYQTVQNIQWMVLSFPVVGPWREMEGRGRHCKRKDWQGCRGHIIKGFVGWARVWSQI